MESCNSGAGGFSDRRSINPAGELNSW
jgi:hypothetical protein